MSSCRATKAKRDFATPENLEKILAKVENSDLRRTIERLDRKGGRR